LTNCQLDLIASSSSRSDVGNVGGSIGVERVANVAALLLSRRSAHAMIVGALESQSEAVRRRAVLQVPVLLGNMGVTITQVRINKCSCFENPRSSVCRD
jgi:hypothetical protein